MHDINFFDFYKDKSYDVNYPRVIAIVVAIVMIVGMIAYPLINMGKIKNLDRDRARIEAMYQSDEVKLALASIDEKMIFILNLEIEYDFLKRISEQVAIQNVINDELFKVIVDNTPSDISISSININQSGMTLYGNSYSRESIARFHFNINEADIFTDVFIPTIVQEGYSFLFSLTASFERDE